MNKQAATQATAPASEQTASKVKAKTKSASSPSSSSSHAKALAHIHPTLGIPLKLSIDQISDIDHPNKWIIDEKCAFLNPAFKLDSQSRYIFTWIAVLQLSKSTKKQEKGFAALLKLVLAQETTIEDFEKSVFELVPEPPTKKPKKEKSEGDEKEESSTQMDE